LQAAHEAKYDNYKASRGIPHYLNGADVTGWRAPTHTYLSSLQSAPLVAPCRRHRPAVLCLFINQIVIHALCGERLGALHYAYLRRSPDNARSAPDNNTFLSQGQCKIYYTKERKIAANFMLGSIFDTANISFFLLNLIFPFCMQNKPQFSAPTETLLL